MRLLERRRWTAAALGVGAIAWPRLAQAQVRWDAGFLGGVTERVTTGDRTSPKPEPGPSGELQAHVAVLPMLRVGGYAAFDLSPAPGTRARQVYGVGLRAKVTPPLLGAPWHTWAFLGVGVAEAYTPLLGQGGAFDTGFLEVPVGVGIGHRLRGPWEICAELGARFVVASGSLHVPTESGSGAFPPFARDDLLAVSLSVGVSLMP